MKFCLFTFFSNIISLSLKHSRKQYAKFRDFYIFKFFLRVFNFAKFNTFKVIFIKSLSKILPIFYLSTKAIFNLNYFTSILSKEIRICISLINLIYILLPQKRIFIIISFTFNISFKEFLIFLYLHNINVSAFFWCFFFSLLSIEKNSQRSEWDSSCQSPKLLSLFKFIFQE